MVSVFHDTFLLNSQFIFYRIGYTIDDDMIHVVKTHCRKGRTNDKQRLQIVVDGPKLSTTTTTHKVKGTSAKKARQHAPISYYVKNDTMFPKSPGAIAAEVAYLLSGCYPFANRFDLVGVAHLSRKF
jgi:hypothetical protein